MITKTQVLNFIHSAADSDIAELATAVQLRRNRLAMEVKHALNQGDTVSFTSAKKRSPYTYTAVLVGKRQSRCTVKITGPSWGKYRVGSLVTVPFAMLSRI